MKKSLKLMSAVLMALATFVPAQADELTIFEGTATSDCIPVRPTYYDWEGYNSQAIYPEAQLAAMQGQPIKAMKFYFAEDYGNVMNGGKLAFYVGTTSQASYSGWSPSLIDESTLTKVAEMSMTHGDANLVITFDEPWTYEGGNLVIQTTVVEEGTYSDYGHFLGTAADDPVGAYGTYAVNTEKFYPMTTFTYGSDTPQPEEWELGDVNHDKTVDVSDVTLLITYVLNGSVAGDFFEGQANVNGDDEVDVADVTMLITTVLGSI